MTARLIALALCLSALALAGDSSAAPPSCFEQLTDQLRQCKTAFEGCYCQVCPRAQRCGGTLSIDQCPSLGACISQEKSCREQAEKRYELCRSTR